MSDIVDIEIDDSQELLDLFAAAALVGAVANREGALHEIAVAYGAYQMAVWMMQAREAVLAAEEDDNAN